MKGDICDAPSGHRIESKYTDARQYTLKLSDLHGIAEACRCDETPVLIVNFRRSDERYAIISYADYLDLQRSD